MDDNTRQVLVALASALGGLATGVLIAKLGFDHARRLESDRWQREDRDRNRAEKVAAYAAFLAAMESNLRWLLIEQEAAIAGATEATDPHDDPDASGPLQTIHVLAPDVAEAATLHYNWSIYRSREVAERWRRNAGAGGGPEIPFVDVAEYHAYRDEVVEAVHADLGVPERDRAAGRTDTDVNVT